MTEQEIKAITKWVVDISNYPLSDQDKEIIKHEVDEANSWGELNLVLMEALSIGENKAK